MTFKKIFAFTLAILLVVGSVFAVSAEIPPYSDGVLHIFCGYDVPDAGEKWQEALANYNLFFEVNKDDIKDLKGIKVSEVMAVND